MKEFVYYLPGTDCVVKILAPSNDIAAKVLQSHIFNNCRGALADSFRLQSTRPVSRMVLYSNITDTTKAD